MARTIEVIVGTSGDIRIESTGFKGPDCEKATAFLEQALGTVKVKTRKPDYYGRTRNQQKVGT